MLRESSAGYLANTGEEMGGCMAWKKGTQEEQESGSKRRSRYWFRGRETKKASETTTEDVNQSGGLRETKACVYLIFTMIIVIAIPTATAADTADL